VGVKAKMIPGDWRINESGKKEVKRIYIQVELMSIVFIIATLILIYYYFESEMIYFMFIIGLNIVITVWLILGYRYDLKRCINRVRIENDGITLSTEKESKKINWENYGREKKSRYDLLLWKIINNEPQRRIDSTIAKDIRNSYKMYYNKI
jgi:hypothetical protein